MPPRAEAAKLYCGQHLETQAPATASRKLVVGEVEKAFLVGPNFIYDARIDSGAETSSMDARDVQRRA